MVWVSWRNMWAAHGPLTNCFFHLTGSEGCVNTLSLRLTALFLLTFLCLSVAMAKKLPVFLSFRSRAMTIRTISPPSPSAGLKENTWSGAQRCSFRPVGVQWEFGVDGYGGLWGLVRCPRRVRSSNNLTRAVLDRFFLQDVIGSMWNPHQSV